MTRIGLSLLALLVLLSGRVEAQERPLDAKLQTAFEKGQLSGLHNVLVIRDGEILAERHFAGIDRPWFGQSDIQPR